MKSSFCIVIILLAVLSLAGLSLGQAKKNSRVAKPSVTATPQPTAEPKIEEPAKRNGRPSADLTKVKNVAIDAKGQTYFYEFTRPGFTYGNVAISHDDTGKGTISFLKDGYDETITDPVDLSAVTIAKIDSALTDLKFLDSTDEYQHPRDYSHLGNITFRLKADGRERTVKFNWTENLAARTLMDEYRKITNEYTWRFEILIARENQKLLTPGLMELIDSYIARKEISDPKHLIPFLTELSTDERLPLMARNRATKLIKQIEKAKK